MGHVMDDGGVIDLLLLLPSTPASFYGWVRPPMLSPLHDRAQSGPVLVLRLPAMEISFGGTNERRRWSSGSAATPEHARRRRPAS